MAVWKSIGALAAFGAATANAAALRPQARSYPTLVESAELRESIDIDALVAKAEIFQSFAYRSEGKNRLVASQGHQDTVNYIHDQIAAFPDYYTVEKQPWELLVGAGANVTANNRTIEGFATTLAPAGDVSGPLVAIPNLACNASDFDGIDLTGSIALVHRGVCESGIKNRLAAAKGALGVVIYNNGEGNLKGYSLSLFEDPATPYIPNAGITQGEGEGLVALLSIGQKIHVNVKTDAELKTTYNVNAQTKGGDQDNVIHISGHSDSVAAGPGINDNGSGSISLLEIAIQLTNYTVNNAVRISWWAGEEEGLLGATYYVRQLNQPEKAKIRLLLDFDMMASPNYAFQIYDGDGSAYNMTGPPGSAEAEAEFTNFFANIAHVNHTEIEFDGRSDYGPFLEAGIAAGGIACGAEGIKTEEEEAMFGGAAGVPYDVNYHEDGDTVNNLNHEAWVMMTRAIAHSTATYARSFEGLPPRNSSAAQKRSMKYKDMREGLRKSKRFLRWV
ncbi:Zn-dependent exopeptidase [Polyplosphaeria fusca]|uniref:Peptide hydrolase n=1 Tax=Polyplosphaeria fusca TaxID=682080 RepID=A0A9P4QLV2_9PLEO|nr:Zn-dependent exopeptidase [Polyplosphaeria fusca]